MITMQPEVLYDYARIAKKMDPKHIVTDVEGINHGAYERNTTTAWLELHIHEYTADEAAFILGFDVAYTRKKAKRLGLTFTH